MTERNGDQNKIELNVYITTLQ